MGVALLKLRLSSLTAFEDCVQALLPSISSCWIPGAKVAPWVVLNSPYSGLKMKHKTILPRRHPPGAAAPYHLHKLSS